MVGQFCHNYSLKLSYYYDGKKTMNKGVNIMPAKINLTNKVFGRLTVIRQAENI